MNKLTTLGHFELLGHEVTLLRRDQDQQTTFEVLTEERLPAYTFTEIRNALRAFSAAIDLIEGKE